MGGCLVDVQVVQGLASLLATILDRAGSGYAVRALHSVCHVLLPTRKLATTHALIRIETFGNKLQRPQLERHNNCILENLETVCRGFFLDGRILAQLNNGSCVVVLALAELFELLLDLLHGLLLRQGC